MNNDADILAKLRKDLDILCAEVKKLSGFCDGLSLTLNLLSTETPNPRFRPTLARGDLRKHVIDILKENPEGVHLNNIHFMIKEITGIDVNRYHVSGALTQLKSVGIVQRAITGWQLAEY